MTSPETASLNTQEASERETPPVERVSESPEQQVENAFSYAESVVRENDPVAADTEFTGYQEEYVSRGAVQPEALAAANETIASELSEIRSEEKGLLERLNGKLEKYRGLLAAFAFTAGVSAASAEGSDNAAPETKYAAGPTAEQPVPGETAAPDVPSPLRIDRNLVDPGRVSGERGFAPSGLSQDEGLEGLIALQARGETISVPEDPVVLRLTRELIGNPDGEGSSPEQGAVMEGYGGFTEGQLARMQRIAERVQNEHGMIFSRGQDGMFHVESQHQGKQGEVDTDVDSVFESLKHGAETVHAHTHPVDNDLHGLTPPSPMDFIVEGSLKERAAREGIDTGKLRNIVVAKHGIWEYSSVDVPGQRTAILKEPRTVSEYYEKLRPLLGGETLQNREDLVSWAEQRGIHLKFTPFPEKILSSTPLAEQSVSGKASAPDTTPVFRMDTELNRPDAVPADPEAPDVVPAENDPVQLRSTPELTMPDADGESGADRAGEKREQILKECQQKRADHYKNILMTTIEASLQSPQAFGEVLTKQVVKEGWKKLVPFRSGIMAIQEAIRGKDEFGCEVGGYDRMKQIMSGMLDVVVDAALLGGGGTLGKNVLAARLAYDTVGTADYSVRIGKLLMLLNDGSVGSMEKIGRIGKIMEEDGPSEKLDKALDDALRSVHDALSGTPSEIGVGTASGNPSEKSQEPDHVRPLSPLSYE